MNGIMCGILSYGIYLTVFLHASLASYYDSSWRHKSCSHILHKAKHSNTEAEQPPVIDGEWTSHRCEIRPGPEYVLRRYYFKGHYFKLRQYYYSEPGCTHPKYSVIAEGKVKILRPSWFVPGGTEAKYTVHNVSVIPYTKDITEYFRKQTEHSCKGLSGKSWKPFQKTKILHFPPYSKNFHKMHRTLDDFDCSYTFNLTFHELQLIRLEIHRPHVYNSYKFIKMILSNKTRTEKELFLGDIHTDIKRRFTYRPTNYQPSLKTIESKRCPVCSQIANSNDFYPPRLHRRHSKRTRLSGKAESLSGEWVSSRCETRQYGQFLTRYLTFYPDGRSWKGHYDFFHDPLCTNPSFSLSVKGSYVNGGTSKLIPHADNFAFRITRLKVKATSQNMANNLNYYSGSGCGVPHSWKLDMEQDVTESGGCVTLGITLPNIEFEIMKIDVTHRRKYLFIGQRPTDGGKLQTSERRPTSFQEPLIKCQENSKLPILANSLPKFEKFQSPSGAGKVPGGFVLYVLSIFFVIFVIKY